MHGSHLATRKLRQRRIPPAIQEILDLYCREQDDGHGGYFVVLDRDARRRLQQEFGRAPAARIAGGCRAHQVRCVDAARPASARRRTQVR